MTSKVQPAHPLSQELEFYKKLSNRNVVAYIDHHYDPLSYTLYIFLE